MVYLVLPRKSNPRIIFHFGGNPTRNTWFAKPCKAEKLFIHARTLLQNLPSMPQKRPIHRVKEEAAKFVLLSSKLKLRVAFKLTHFDHPLNQTFQHRIITLLDFHFQFQQNSDLRHINFNSFLNPVPSHKAPTSLVIFQEMILEVSQTSEEYSNQQCGMKFSWKYNFADCQFFVSWQQIFADFHFRLNP